MSKIFNRIILIIALTISLITICFAGDEQNASNVIIFISFSMPKESIKGWLDEAAKIHAPVVIRGLVNNSFKETLKCMNTLMSDNKGGLQLDPTLFRQFQVSKVPAVVVRKSIQCSPNQSCMNDYDIVYGDVHLDYALQAVIRRNDTLSSIAKIELKRLRGGQNA